MKKTLLIMPFAALMLAGCMPNLGGNGAKKTTTAQDTKSTTRPAGTQSTGPAAPSTPGASIPTVNLGPEIKDGYKRVMEAPKNDTEYLFGVYQANLDKNLFLNGHHHTDENGEYPYYLSTTEDVTKASRVKVHYVDDTHYTIQIVAGSGEFSTYDGKYLSVYLDGTHTSIKASDVVGQWYYLESYTSNNVKADINCSVSDLNNPTYGVQPIAIGSSQEYQTLSACTPNYFTTNFMARFWEPAN